MDVEWIDKVMRLNTCVVATETSIRIQAVRIIGMTEARRTTSGAQSWFRASQKHLHLLRERRDAMLDGVEVEE